MKIFSILGVLLILSSCGKIDAIKSNSIGEVLSTQAVQADGNTVAQVQTICTKLQNKASSLGGLGQTQFNFNFSEKNCNVSNFALPSQFSTKVVNSAANGYQYIISGGTSNGALFYFSDVETHDKGTMAAFCSQGTNLKNPTLVDGNFVYMQTVGISSADCTAGNGEICVYLQWATKTGDGSSAKVHTKEWIKFKTDDSAPRSGYWSLRKSVSKADCKESETRGKLAELLP